jgi:hypothetical protein
MSTRIKVWAFIALCVSSVMPAWADSLPAPLLSSDTPYSSLVLVRGGTLTSATMMTASAGTVTVKLSDLTFTQALSALSFSLSDPTAQLHATSGAGVWSWDVSAPTLLYATVYAVAGTAKNIGLYALDVSFTPTQLPDQVPVPLPAAGWMLLSGIASLLTSRRKHTAVTQTGLTIAPQGC